MLPTMQLHVRVGVIGVQTDAFLLECAHKITTRPLAQRSRTPTIPWYYLSGDVTEFFPDKEQID